MVHHDWSEKDVDWAGIGAAAEYLGDFCHRWARFRGQTKEKYGSVRFYAQLGWGMSLHGLIYPGYHYSQFPKWLWKLDIYYLTPVLDFLFGKVYYKYKVFIYRQAYKNALKKWPHIREEILCCADYPEYLEGL